MSAIVNQIQAPLDELSDPDIAEHSQRLFKTAAGEYGVGEVFIGIRMPVLRRVAKQHRVRETQIQDLLTSAPATYVNY